MKIAMGIVNNRPWFNTSMGAALIKPNRSINSGDKNYKHIETSPAIGSSDFTSLFNRFFLKI